MSQPRFASAVSSDPSADVAIERCAAVLGDELGAEPDLVLAFVSAQHAPDYDGLGDRLRRATGARRLVGTSAGAVVRDDRELEDGPGIALLGVRAAGIEVRTTTMEARRDAGEAGFRVEPELELRAEEGVVLFADPYTFPAEPWLREQGEKLVGRAVVGGLASGGSGPREHALWVDDLRIDHGAIALAIGGDVELRTAVSQGCRPIGEPLVVTECRGNAVLKLRGKPAVPTLFEVLGDLPERDRELFRRGPHVGLAVDPSLSKFTASDLLVRNVIGLLPKEEGIAVGDPTIRRGMTLQFMLRDAASASDELARLLGERRGDWDARGGPDAGALLFTCGGRGTNLFRALHHDARAVQEHLGPALPLAGFFANGEIGPVGGQPHLHGFTASLGYLTARA